MKKFTIISTVLIAMIINATAQIPNGGFENWTTVSNSIEPTSWHSSYSLMDSIGNYVPVTKSTDHYPANIGSFSARISNDTERWNSGISPGEFLGWGFLTSTKFNDKPLFPVIGHPKALCGYYKFLPQNGDAMSINVFFYKNGAEVTNVFYKSTVAATSWTSFKIFVNDTLYNSVDSARISFSTCNEPKNGQGGPLGNSVLYVDNLSFDKLVTTGISQINEASTVSVYPNPASNKLTVTFANNVSKQIYFKIFNAQGQQVFIQKISNKTETTNLNISLLPEGIYFIRAATDEQTVYSNKLIIARD